MTIEKIGSLLKLPGSNFSSIGLFVEYFYWFVLIEYKKGEREIDNGYLTWTLRDIPIEESMFEGPRWGWGRNTLSDKLSHNLTSAPTETPIILNDGR